MDDVNRTSLQRRCFALDLKDDAAAIDSYKRWHRPGGPPPEVTRSLRDAGIAALDIYLIGNRLFMIMDSDPAAASSAKSTDDSDNPHVQAWEALLSSNPSYPDAQKVRSMISDAKSKGASVN